MCSINISDSPGTKRSYMPGEHQPLPWQTIQEDATVKKPPAHHTSCTLTCHCGLTTSFTIILGGTHTHCTAQLIKSCFIHLHLLNGVHSLGGVTTQMLTDTEGRLVLSKRSDRPQPSGARWEQAWCCQTFIFSGKAQIQNFP